MSDNRFVEFVEELQEKANRDGYVSLTSEEIDKLKLAVMAVVGRNLLDQLQEELIDPVRDETNEVVREFDEK